MRRTFRRAVSIRRALAALVLFVLMAGGIAYVVVTRTGYGGDAVDWAARQVVAIAERSIVPEIGFERFEYRAPRTLRFVGLTLTSPGGVRVAEASSVDVELTRMPRIGEPIYIERVSVVRGVVELVETRDQDGRLGFDGLVPFVEREGDGGASESAENEQGFESRRRLNDVLRMREVTLEDCGVRYTPMGDRAPMRVAGVSTTLDLEPVDEDGRHWHRFDLELERGDALRAELLGRFDLDRLVFELEPSSLRLNLTGEPAQELPPAIQALLGEHEARGDLLLTASGTVPVREIAAARATGAVELRDFSVAFGEYQLPIQSALLSLELRDGIARIVQGDIAALGGEALVSGSVDLVDERRPASARWSIGGMRLREILRGGVPEGTTPKLAGLVVSSGEATMDGRGIGSLRGGGTVDITEGWFGTIGVIKRVLRLVDREYGAEGAKLTSELHSAFVFRGAAVDMSTIEVVGPVMAGRGDGVLWFDGRLDVVMNAGPLERVQDLLGGVGRILGVVTDQLVKYRVRGTVKEPEVRVLPLGVGAKVDRSELP